MTKKHKHNKNAKFKNKQKTNKKTKTNKKQKVKKHKTIMAEAPIRPITGEVTRNYPPEYDSFFPFNIRLSNSHIIPHSILPHLKPPLQIHYEQNFNTQDEHFPKSFISKLETTEPQNENEDYLTAPKFASSFLDSITPADLKLSHGFTEILFPGYEFVKASPNFDLNFGPNVRTKTDLTKVSSHLL